MKPAGGIRTAKEAIQYLVVLYETLGPRWMTPDLFRFGARSLLNDVPHAAPQGAHRPLPGPGLLHARLIVAPVAGRIPRIRVAGSHREVGRGVGVATAPTLREAVAFDAVLPPGVRATSSWPSRGSTVRRPAPGRPGWSRRSTERPKVQAWTHSRCSPHRSRKIRSVRPSQATGGIAVEGRCSDLVAGPPATADGHLVGRPHQ